MMAEPEVQIINDELRVGDLGISFKRTIRVPDNKQASELPPDLGNFPIDFVGNFNFPPEMAKKGGAFLPMHPSEALWIDLNSYSKSPTHDDFAVKVYVSGINVISGEPAEETYATLIRRRHLLVTKQSMQDYLAVPHQYWIDGIAVAPGLVRQFVATKLGSGQSIEAQVTGLDVSGGITIEIIPAKRDERKQIFVRVLTGQCVALSIRDSFTIIRVKKMIHAKLASKGEMTLSHAGKILSDQCKIGDYPCIQKDSTINMSLPMRGGLAVTRQYSDPEEAGAVPTSRTELSIAAGGYIEQAIVEDKTGVHWDIEKRHTFHVQILNASQYHHITGSIPANKPFDVQTYAQMGYPFFKLYEEPTNVSGYFPGVLSVNQLAGISDPFVKPRTQVIGRGPPGNGGQGGATSDDHHASDDSVKADSDVGFFDTTANLPRFRSAEEMEREISSRGRVLF